MRVNTVARGRWLRSTIMKHSSGLSNTHSDAEIAPDTELPNCLRGPEEYLLYLKALGERRAHPVNGFFGPQSQSWRVNRESALLLGGMRALLMQIAHPKVAQGVADHSAYKEDPLGRGIRTFQAVHAMVFGTREEAIRAAATVHAIHCRVQGRLAHPPRGMDPEYQANDPDLLMWVYATLMDSAVVTYELFFTRLTNEEREALYQEGKLFIQLFGVPESLVPPTWQEFQDWMTETLSGPTIAVTPVARDIARSLLKGSALTLLLSPLNYVLAAGMLPDRLRQEYGLGWNPVVRVFYRAITSTVRVAVRISPANWRAMPLALHGEKRCSLAGPHINSGASGSHS